MLLPLLLLLLLLAVPDSVKQAAAAQAMRNPKRFLGQIQTSL
jgi:hypothetical protein